MIDTMSFKPVANGGKNCNFQIISTLSACSNLLLFSNEASLYQYFTNGCTL